MMKKKNIKISLKLVESSLNIIKRSYELRTAVSHRNDGEKLKKRARPKPLQGVPPCHGGESLVIVAWSTTAKPREIGSLNYLPLLHPNYL